MTELHAFSRALARVGDGRLSRPRARLILASSLLGLVVGLLGCGQTEHHFQIGTEVAGEIAAGGRDPEGVQEPTPAAGSPASAAGGKPAAAGGSGPGGAGEGAADAPGPNCLYPYRAVTPLSGDTDVADYVVSAPFALAAATRNWGTLSGAYDINGDWVSDVLYRDASYAKYRLLQSAPPPNILDMKEVECDALSELPVGRLMLRDLDADGALDFIIGLEQRFVAYLNRPAGIEKVLDYAPPGATERLQLITLETIDLDGDERLDLVIGFDRLESAAALAFDAGVASFLQGEDGQFRPNRAIAQRFGDLGAELGTLTGYLAAGHFVSTGEPVVLVFGAERGTGHAFAAAPKWVGDLGPTYLLRDELPETAAQAFALPRAGQPDLLAVVGEDELHVMDWSSGLLVALFSVPLAYSGGLTHELGGGPERPRHYFYDLDLDGDEDFLERSPGPGRELTLHVNLGNGAFAAPQTFSVGTAAFAELPFLNVGPARAVLDEDQVGSADSTPSIYTLVSAKMGVQ